MASKKKSIGNKTSEPRPEQVSFSVEPGTKVKITLDVGDEILDGKVPITALPGAYCLPQPTSGTCRRLFATRWVMSMLLLLEAAQAFNALLMAVIPGPL